jgi:hypothetical protein
VGASGTTLHLEMHPIGAVGLLAARIALTRLPDPEIDLPAGAEMTLQVNCASLERSWGKAPEQITLDEGLSEFLRQQPVGIRKADGSPTADLINVALIGSEETVALAFAEAGWSRADRLTKTSFKQVYTAFTQRQGYAEAPVSTLYYEGREPDLVFQKSLNSIAKRHHVRLWRVAGPDGEPIWLGAATHDVTVGFDRKTFGLLHKIDENIDRERRKVTADLEFTGALRGQTDLARMLPTSDGAKTDQALSVARVEFPEHFALEATPVRSEGSRAHRFARRLILEARQYALRENPYYLAFASVRKIATRKAPVLEASSVLRPANDADPDASGAPVAE